MRPELRAPELLPADLEEPTKRTSGGSGSGCGYQTNPLPDAFALALALGTIAGLESRLEQGTEGAWVIAPPGPFLELVVRSPHGKVASFSLKGGKDGTAPTPAQLEADARALVELRNQCDWILRAARYGLEHGFLP